MLASVDSAVFSSPHQNDSPAGISDHRHLITHLRAALTSIQQGNRKQAEASLRFAQGLVNVTEYLEPSAKTYMAAVFAEFHAALLGLTDGYDEDGRGSACTGEEAADVMFDHFLQAMRLAYGADHVVLADCYVLVAASRASRGGYQGAVECLRRALALRLFSLGLLHPRTALDHLNLGLAFRLSGDLLASRRQLLLCRKVSEAVHGPLSLQVAKVDLSLGQTECLSGQRWAHCYLHYYLCFHARALLLGPRHADSMRSYALVCSTRNRESGRDRLVCSVELLDRIDQLGYLEEEEGVGDMAAVVSELVTAVFTLKTPSSTSQDIAVLGDALVFRESSLAGLLGGIVSRRMDYPGRHREDTRSLDPYITTPFNRRSSVEELTRQLMTMLLPPLPNISSDGKPVAQRNDSGSATVGAGSTDENIGTLLSADHQAFLHERHERRLEGRSKRPALSPQNIVHSDLGNDNDGGERSEGFTEESNVALIVPPLSPPSTSPLPVIARPQTPPHSTSFRPEQATLHASPLPKRVTSPTPTPPSSPFSSPAILPSPVSPPPSTRSTSPTQSSPSPSLSPSSSPSTNSTVKARTPPLTPLLPPKKASSFLRVAEHKHNKAFFGAAGKPPSEVKSVLLPPSKRGLVISTNANGERVSIRPTVPGDILEALHLKIYSLGIFPYLILNDHQAIEKEESEFIESGVGRKRAETEAAAIDIPPPVSTTISSSGTDTGTALTTSTSDGGGAGGGKKVDESNGRKCDRIIPLPPPLPTAWPPQVENGMNVGGNCVNVPPGGPCLPPGAGAGAGGGGAGAISGLFGAIQGAVGAAKKGGVGGGVEKPKRKQLHWDMLEGGALEGTIWSDDRDKANVDELFQEEDDIFAECADLFAAAVKKDDKKNAQKKDVSKAASKNVAVLDGQKSQNMNIMLAKFGSRRKVSEIIHAIVSLQHSSFTLSTVSTMLEYTPASMEGGEVGRVTAVVEREGVEKLGKAEAYLYEMSKVPRVENYLRTLALILSIEEMKESLLAGAASIITINEQVRGSVRLKVFFRAVLKVGNILNDGTKKSGAVAFKLSSLSKLSQTKSNSGKTVLQYLASTLDKEMPGILELRKDLDSLQAAQNVSFPTLQQELGKAEAGIKVLSVLRDDMKKALDAAEEEDRAKDGSGEAESGPESDPEDDPPDDPPDEEKLADEKKKKSTVTTPPRRVTPAIYASLLQHEESILAMRESMSTQLALARTCHAELCAYLGEDAGTDPETVYGALGAFVTALGMATAKRR